MKRQRTGYDNILKMLKKHLPSCTMNRYSDREKRKCSCGRDKAIEELESMVRVWDRHWETMREKIMRQK